jgi:hypothetical protein
MDKVKFTAMKDGDREDYEFLTEHEIDYASKTAERLLGAMVELDESLSGYQVTRLGHSLQSATRAWRDGADIDWVVSALLHDIGDIYAPYNHDEYAAAILRPSCASNAPGWSRSTAISRSSITPTMSAAIRMRASLQGITPISMIAQHSANAGIRTASIRTIRMRTSNSSATWSRGLCPQSL